MWSYAVLMPVYAREKAEYFKQSIESMLQQTVSPSEFVVVCDGPLTPALDTILQDFREMHSDLFTIVCLKKNKGLGPALREGLLYCTQPMVVRMDSDDIALPDRAEKILQYMKEQHLDVCSSHILEVQAETGAALQQKSVPLQHAEILRYMKWRNPINHPAVAFRKECVLQAGSYRDMPFFEDYDLWIRLRQQGAIFGNYNAPLLRMRVSAHFYARRGGRHYVKAIIHFWNAAYQEGFVTKAQMLLRIVVRGMVGLLPNWVRAAVYKGALRKE